jgi:hypothetical protein
MTSSLRWLAPLLFGCQLVAVGLPAQASAGHRLLIIDMHFHALAADFAGPPPATNRLIARRGEPVRSLLR